jgi:hypothetical protein
MIFEAAVSDASSEGISFIGSSYCHSDMMATSVRYENMGMD